MKTLFSTLTFSLLSMTLAQAKDSRPTAPASQCLESAFFSEPSLYAIPNEGKHKGYFVHHEKLDGEHRLVLTLPSGSIHKISPPPSFFAAGDGSGKSYILDVSIPEPNPQVIRVEVKRRAPVRPAVIGVLADEDYLFSKSIPEKEKEIDDLYATFAREIRFLATHIERERGIKGRNYQARLEDGFREGDYDKYKEMVSQLQEHRGIDLESIGKEDSGRLINLFRRQLNSGDKSGVPSSISEAYASYSEMKMVFQERLEKTRSTGIYYHSGLEDGLRAKKANGQHAEATNYQDDDTRKRVSGNLTESAYIQQFEIENSQLVGNQITMDAIYEKMLARRRRYLTDKNGFSDQEANDQMKKELLACLNESVFSADLYKQVDLYKKSGAGRTDLTEFPMRVELVVEKIGGLLTKIDPNWDSSSDIGIESPLYVPNVPIKSTDAR